MSILTDKAWNVIIAIILVAQTFCIVYTSGRAVAAQQELQEQHQLLRATMQSLDNREVQLVDMGVLLRDCLSSKR